ncbi:MAG: tol-pal system protein YbgF [Xanthomonadales bacterium]|nr:tol-pal system protein YbgF [Xanthomonadales bacterium]
MRILPALLIALMLPALPAMAQRASLAERVDALEAHAADDSAKLETLNQINALKEEVRGLRGQVEELQQQLNQQKEATRNQYLDVDGRLNRLEGSGKPADGNGQGAPAAQPVQPQANAPSVIPAESAPEASNGNDRADYDAAFKALKGGDYVKSSRGFKAFIDRWPKSALIPNARYWLGESYYATGNYEMAAAQFKQVVDTYPTHPKAADAAKKLRMSQQAMSGQKPQRKPAAR